MRRVKADPMRRVRRAARAASLLCLLPALACEVERDDRAAAPDTTVIAPPAGDDVPDSADAPAGPPSVSAGCAILEETALEQALGHDVVMNDNTTGNCVATPASGVAGAPTIDFRIEPRVSAYDYFSAQPDAEAIPNLGERSVWATLNETTGYVVTVTGGRSIVVAIARADGVTAESRRQAEAVARLLLER